MSEINDLLQRYKEVRQRLRFPSNAVQDTGIDLRRNRTVVSTPPPPPSATLTSQQKEPPKGQKLQAIPETCIVLSYPVPQVLTVASSLQIIAAEFGITMAEITSKKKTRRYSRPRQVAIHILRKNYARMGGSWLARQLHLDHTTVIYARKRITALMAEDPVLNDKVLAVEAKLALFSASSTSAHSKPHLGEGEEGNVLQQTIPPLDR